MFKATRKSVHDRYTATVALLLVAFVVSPLVLFASSPAGYTPVLGALALAFSLVCCGMAWNQWKWHSQSAIPSIIERPGGTK